MAYDINLGTNDNWDTVIYIDNVPHRATGLGSSFYVDCDSLPRRRCSHHSLTAAAVAHLKVGGAVITSGHRYSLSHLKEV